MNGPNGLRQENAALRERISRLNAAILRISASLDLDTVLRVVVDSARALTGARYGMIATVDDAGAIQEFIAPGLSADERRHMAEWPHGYRFFEHLRNLPGALRLADVPTYLRSLGYSEELILSKTLQAATAIANARTHRDEQRARADLEALVDTSPVGVVVFDARTGRAVSFNREARRIVGGLRSGDSPTEQLLEVMVCRRGDGREIRLDELPLADEFRNAETVRAEEIELSVPDGRSVTTLVNATPIRSAGLAHRLRPGPRMNRPRLSRVTDVVIALAVRFRSVPGSTSNLSTSNSSPSCSPRPRPSWHRARSRTVRICGPNSSTAWRRKATRWPTSFPNSGPALRAAHAASGPRSTATHRTPAGLERRWTGPEVGAGDPRRTRHRHGRLQVDPDVSDPRLELSQRARGRSARRRGRVEAVPKRGAAREVARTPRAPEISRNRGKHPEFDARESRVLRDRTPTREVGIPPRSRMRIVRNQESPWPARGLRVTIVQRDGARRR